MKKLFDNKLLISPAWELDAETTSYILSDRKRLTELSRTRTSYAKFNEMVVSLLANEQTIEQVITTLGSEVLTFEVFETLFDRDYNYANEDGFNPDNAEPVVSKWKINLKTFEASQCDPDCDDMYHYQPLSRDALRTLSDIFEAFLTSWFDFDEE